MKGYFLVIEGPDGSGKTTIANKLKEYFDNEGINSIITREPGGSEIGEDIRNILLNPNNTEMSPRCEALLYAGARAQHLEEKIKPSLAMGCHVICDRFVHSSLAYQGYGRMLGIDQVMGINKFAMADTYPDRILFFDIKPEQGLLRNKKTDKIDRFEEEDLDFHNKVYQGFKKAIDMYPKHTKIIDASQDINSVFNSVLKIVLEDLNEINSGHNTR